MDEQSLARQVFKNMTPPRPVSHVYPKSGGFVTVHKPGDVEPLNGFDSHRTAQHVEHVWNRSAVEVALFQRRVVKLDPAYANVFGLFRMPPKGLTADIAKRAYGDAAAMFGVIFDGHPGTRLEKFAAVGSPPAMAHWCGAAKKPLTTAMHVMELEWEYFGNRPTPRADGRVKPVGEPSTGLQWPSIQELAIELGCAEGTLYNHLRRNPAQPSIRGRVFAYVDRPLPGSIDAMTEDEKDAERQFTRAMGFEPGF